MSDSFCNVYQCFVYVFVYIIYWLCNVYTNAILSLPDLERAWVGCAIASAGIQIFAILTMICGLWPADCANAKRSTLYLVTSILCLIAGNHDYKNLHMASHLRSAQESGRSPKICVEGIEKFFASAGNCLLCWTVIWIISLIFLFINCLTWNETPLIFFFLRNVNL